MQRIPPGPVILPDNRLPRRDEIGVQINAGQPWTREVRSGVVISVLRIISVLMGLVV